MPTESFRATWATYQAAWEDVSPDERLRLLNESVADDCVYTDPNRQTNNRAELIDYIEKFRAGMPGGTFKNHQFTDHHQQSLAGWMLYNANGSELQPGNSYAHFGDDGRITRVTGFFEVSP